MYLLRVDDASAHWAREKWHRMYDLLARQGVRPVVAIIPDNRDPDLLAYPLDDDFDSTMLKWIGEGWTPAMHGYTHAVMTDRGGLNPVQEKSEFAGLPLAEQKRRVGLGYRALRERGIQPRLFVAPYHTFDGNTLTALREETDIRIISDTVAVNVWMKDDFFFIPQQSGMARALRLPLVTFCYHPNVMDEGSFGRLERFIVAHREQFVSFDQIELKPRKRSLADRTLSLAYHVRKRLERLRRS